MGDKKFSRIRIYREDGTIRRVITYSVKNGEVYDDRQISDIDLKVYILPEDFDIEKYFPKENKSLPAPKTNGGLPLPKLKEYGSDKDDQII
jgi:hypothetical protein